MSQMTVGALIEILKKQDPNLPVYIGKWHDYHGYCEHCMQGTDMSGYEPAKMGKDCIEVFSTQPGRHWCPPEAHVYIRPY